jgi:hypothetical protein
MLERIMGNLLFACTLGVVMIISVACGIESDGENRGAKNTPLDQPPIQYCELADHPEKYDGQTVRVRATLYFMMHGYKFMDESCLGDEKETAVLLNAEHEAKLAKEAGSEEYNPWSFPTVIAKGKFRRVTPNRRSDSVADNSYLIFEVETIEGVIKSSIKPSGRTENDQ